MAMPMLILTQVSNADSYAARAQYRLAYVALVLHPATLLGDAEQVEGLTPLQAGHLVEL